MPFKPFKSAEILPLAGHVECVVMMSLGDREER